MREPVKRVLEVLVEVQPLAHRSHIFCIVGSVRDLLAAAKASPRPWHLLISLGLAALPSSSVRLSLCPQATAYLITISSSSIDSPVTHARLACFLPYTWASMPYR